MPKNKQLKINKRLRFDKTMLVIGLVSICGGLLVYGSYAYSKVDTTKPGVVELSRLSNNSLGYKISLKKDLHYCFAVNERSPKAIIVTNTRSIEYELDEGCFKASINAKNAELYVSGVDETENLIIE